MKRALVASAAVVALVLVTFTLPACDEEVGYPCEIPQGSVDTGAGVQVLSQATDCRSRLCIYVAGGTGNRPQCTEICETDDDCPKYSDDRAHLCKDDYVCVVGMTSGALKCCKMCVCKKYLPNLTTYNKQMQDTCAGITSNCPKL